MYDSPYQTAALFSMRGVNCVVTSQWGQSEENNPSFFDIFDELHSNQTVGDAVQILRTIPQSSLTSSTQRPIENVRNSLIRESSTIRKTF